MSTRLAVTFRASGALRSILSPSSIASSRFLSSSSSGTTSAGDVGAGKSNTDPAGAFHKDDFIAQDPYPLVGRLDPPPATLSTGVHAPTGPLGGPVHFPDSALPHAPLDRSGESVGRRRARLLWQSRKRGILETDLLLSTFAAKHLATMNAEELTLYDKLLDEPDWEIYYYATGKKPAPERFTGTKLLQDLQDHVRNEERVTRSMPGLRAGESANYRADRALDDVRFADEDPTTTTTSGDPKSDGRPIGEEERNNAGKDQDLGEKIKKDDREPAGYAS